MGCRLEATTLGCVQGPVLQIQHPKQGQGCHRARGTDVHGPMEEQHLAKTEGFLVDYMTLKGFLGLYIP